MGRGLWFAAGAGAGVYAAVRARRAAELLTIDGLRDRVGAAVVGARMFRDEVAQGRADSEDGLRERLGAVLHSVPELENRRDTSTETGPETGTETKNVTSTDQEGPT